MILESVNRMYNFVAVDVFVVDVGGYGSGGGCVAAAAVQQTLFSCICSFSYSPTLYV